LLLRKPWSESRAFWGQEGEIIRVIKARMKALSFDEVRIDAMGNLLGRIGDGKTKILFDSHLDTVDVKDAEEWEIPPFSGEIVGGRLHGQGSADMKSAAAASIYAALVARELGFTQDKTVFVSCTVFEVNCDGENLKHLFQEVDLRPDYVIVCEPSGNLVTLGHNGKAQVATKTHGVSAHGVRVLGFQHQCRYPGQSGHPHDRIWTGRIQAGPYARRKLRSKPDSRREQLLRTPD
jgi:putative selenium metabolism hydrolase